MKLISSNDNHTHSKIPMKIDPYIKSLLEIWGRMPTSEDVGYPKSCAYLSEYQAPGFRDGPKLSDITEAERVASFIDSNLSLKQTDVIKTKFRYRLKPHTAKRLSNCVTLREYNQTLNAAIELITVWFYQKKAG